MKVKQLYSAVFFLLLSLSTGSSACAGSAVTPPHLSYTLPPYSLQREQEPTRLSCETADVDGVEVELSLYHDNGVLVRTASVIDEDQKANLDFAKLETAIAEQNVLDYCSLQTTPYKVLVSALPFYADFSNYETNSRNQNCNVGHSGKWYTGLSGLNPAIEAGSIQIGAVYSGGGNAELIVLSQNIICSSTALSFSVPFGFSFGFDSTSAAWTSAPYTNVSVAQAYINGSVYTTSAVEAEIQIQSSSEIRVNPYTSYVTGVQNSCIW